MTQTRLRTPIAIPFCMLALGFSLSSHAQTCVVPSVPTTMKATAMPTSVSLTWGAPATGTLGGYLLYRDGVRIATLSATASTYTDSGRASSITYKYTLQAQSFCGTGPAASLNVTTAPAPLPASVCTAPVKAVDTSSPTSVVGSGTPASCTAPALAAALERGGVVTFNCGSFAIIYVDNTLKLRTDVDTVIDGKGRIILDGQGRTRILSFDSLNFQANGTTVTIQNMIFRYGNRATGTPLPSSSPPCSQGTDLDGGGGALYMRDGILRVINSRFISNKAAPVGPDVGGGAIYVLGNRETTIVRSVFTGNSGANGGAIGALFGNLSIYNSRFASNAATGNGANNGSDSCPSRSTGNGGNGGAVYMDGAEAYGVKVCGSTFTGNRAGTNAFGGAMFRTANAARQAVVLDRCLMKGNSAPNGGGMYMHNVNLSMTASTLADNTATTGGGGAIFVDNSVLDFVNSTFSNNATQQGLGGALISFSNTGTLLNVTFAGNKATGGPGLFGAALHTDRPLTIRNTLFADNLSNDCGAPMACSGADNSGGLNFQWPSTKLACSAADKLCSTGTVFRDPLVSLTLGNNGGPTPTLLPGASSPAKGAGSDCPAFDQRGFARSTACTLGAVE
jgi:hypothetical protein